MAQGAVTTAAPSYTTATTNALSLNVNGGLRVDGSAVTQPVSGTFWQATQPVSGTFWQTTQPVSGTITANQGGAPWSENQTQLNGVALGSPSNYGTSPGAISVQGVNAFVTNSVAVTGTFWQATQPVSGTVAATQSGTWSVTGTATSGTSASGIGLILPGWVAATATPTAVTAGQAVQPFADKVGKLIVNGALRTTKQRQVTTITTTTQTAIVSAGAAGVFNDIYAIIITNQTATACTVAVADGAGTVLVIAAPAGDTRGFTVPVDSAFIQNAAATAWFATLSVAVGSPGVSISVQYVQNT